MRTVHYPSSLPQNSHTAIMILYTSERIYLSTATAHGTDAGDQAVRCLQLPVQVRWIPLSPHPDFPVTIACTAFLPLVPLSSNECMYLIWAVTPLSGFDSCEARSKEARRVEADVGDRETRAISKPCATLTDCERCERSADHARGFSRLCDAHVLCQGERRKHETCRSVRREREGDARAKVNGFRFANSTRKYDKIGVSRVYVYRNGKG